MRPVLVLLVCVVLSLTSAAPLCLPAGNSTLVAPFCRGRFSYEIYIDPDQGTPANLALINALNQLVLSSRAVLPRTCVNSFAEFYCQRLYPRCDRIDSNSVAFLPQALCRSGCDNFHNDCPQSIFLSFLRSANVTSDQALTIYGDCSATILASDPTYPPQITGQDQYPLSQQIWNFSSDNITLPIPCNPPSLNTTISTPCWTPWGATPPDQPLICRIKCPYNVGINFNFFKYVYYIVGFLALTLSTLALCLVVWVPSYRRFPSNLALGIVICGWLLSFGISLSLFKGFYKIRCKDEWTPRDWPDGLCIVQGVSFWIGSTGLGSYWLVFLFTTWFGAFRQKALLGKKWSYGLHAFAIVFAIYPCFVTLVGRKYGARTGAEIPGCTLYPDARSYVAGVYLPVVLGFGFFGTIFFVHLLWMLRTLSKAKLYIRTLVFFTWEYWNIIMSVTVLIKIFIVEYKGFEKSFERWALCALASPDCKGPKLDETLLRFVIITACLAPVFGSLIVLTSGDVLHLIKCLFRKMVGGSSYTFAPWFTTGTTETRRTSMAPSNATSTTQVRSAVDASTYADDDWNF